ncbi:glycosyltransferase family 4 protein [Niveibacterium umoris]|uniref:Glycosyltransferase involved in cell wall biosynthesis n=1 Tax=Niveibacterium umoris TaxID=1193620 RepID=A0A840BG11_9RHOO|nr:glycosyltransferase family 4 protein [Niveibacterium umoris]MBB4011603.1 glycosyltransferase involved in cell wall biosynthesis [Niveibacterium umoris]
MKIAIVNTYYHPQDVGGAERSIRFLAEALVQRGDQVMVVVTGDTDCEEEIAGVRVVRRRRRNAAQVIPLKGAAGKLLWHSVDTWNHAAAREVAAVIKAFAPDVVHTNNLSGISVALWPLLKRAGIPIVHTLRDYYLLCPNTAMFKNDKQCGPGRCFACRTLSSPRLRASKHVDVVVGNSHFILAKHTECGGFPNAATQVVYNAYSPPAPVVARPPPDGDRPVVFGYIGRLAATKGVGHLIETFLRLKSSVKRPVELRIAGVGDDCYEKHLRATAGSETAIRFLGHTRPDAFYDQIDIPVVPSLWDEPLARVLFESFAHALPVIATNTGGSPELIKNRETGWLYDPTDPDALLQTMLGVLEDLDSYSMASQRTLVAAQLFEPTKVVERYREMFVSALLSNENARK